MPRSQPKSIKPTSIYRHQSTALLDSHLEQNKDYFAAAMRRQNNLCFVQDVSLETLIEKWRFEEAIKIKRATAMLLRTLPYTEVWLTVFLLLNDTKS
ncbi:MAG: hypothetical protein ACTS2F_23200 [Thainema sp.]